MTLFRQILAYAAFVATSLLGLTYMVVYLLGGQATVDLIACVVLWIYAEHLWNKIDESGN